MSNVVVLFGQRRATIKTQPTKQLSEIRTEACKIFNISPASGFTLKRNGAKLDLSLQLRFTTIAAGAKLELVRVSNNAASTPVQVFLRTTDSEEQLNSAFTPSTSIFAILRKFEQTERAAGRGNFNITERGKPSGTMGSGRLLYQMPAVRVTNRELKDFEGLSRTLADLGCGPRERMVLRFVPTEIPFEEALERIGKLEEAIGTAETPSEEAIPASSTVIPTKQNTDNVDMLDAPPIIPTGAQDSNSTTEPEIAQSLDGANDAQPAQPAIAVFKPSNSPTPAAARLEVPDSVYEVGINQVKKMKEIYAKEGLPVRLPSDKEIEEKEAVLKQEMEKIQTIKIKINYPQNFIVVQELSGTSTASELYTQVRATLRYPNEPFVLMIPPREKIPDSPKRLTIDLKLRSGASLHLVWANEASQKARNQPALTQDLIDASKELPKTVEPMDVDVDDEKDGLDKGKEKKKEVNKKEGMEKKLKGLLRLGKK
ncbi:GLUT4 regulating protein TUG-domain-containing protein [Geopyxis carbonaria]|nr:GLUT4 regulating protein TUG-domain-containing protein [Geopyxis carbonaria]